MNLDLRCKYSSEYRIAVTGATGYVGRKLLDLFDDTQFIAVEFDSIPLGALVVHLAANVANTRDALIDNVSIDTHVFSAVNEMHRGLIYASSNNVYPSALDCRVTEKLRYNDYYSASKIFAEGFLFDRSTVPFVSLRISDVFGPGQKHGNFFKAIERSVRGQSDLAIYGLGLKRRTHIHVHELAKFIKWIAIDGFSSLPVQTVLNVGYPDSASVAEVIDLATTLTGLQVVDKPVENDQSAFDVRTMQTSFLPGYQPQWGSFREAFADYINEIKSSAGQV